MVLACLTCQISPLIQTTTLAEFISSGSCYKTIIAVKYGSTSGIHLAKNKGMLPERYFTA